MRASPDTDRAKEQAHRWVGRTLRGKWHLERLLGMGGMANVYAARHRNGREAAIKLLLPDFAEHAEVRQRFVREGYIANRISHPGVVGILDDDETEEGNAFLVMELLSGLSLHERIEAVGTLPLAEALFITDQILDVLVAAHTAGVVHRDIKPGNVFLLEDGRVKVLDFGLARVLDGQSEVLTRQGIVLGTVSYMAPEQARANPSEIDPRTDLYAVAATMFYGLTGQFVHPARSVMERLAALLRTRARSIRELAPTLPARVIDCIDRALMFAPAERWPDASAMQSEVRLAFRELTGTVIPDTRRISLHGMPGWHRPVSPNSPAAPTQSEPGAGLDISCVFEPDTSQSSLSIPIELVDA